MNTWWNEYVGIPYKLKGRDKDGIDCWGLVRLIYADKFNIELPSYAFDYTSSTDDIVKQLFASERGGWVSTDVPHEGDLVLFRIGGHVTHVGIMLGDDKFIHAIDGQYSGIESILSARWNKRFDSYYRYSTTAEISAAPFPLKNETLHFSIPAGKSIKEILREVDEKFKVDEAIKLNRVIFLNGKPVAQDSDLIVNPGDQLDYSIIPSGRGAGRLFAMLAVAAFAWYVAPYIVGGSAAGLGSAGWAALGGSQIAAANAVAFGINMVGSLLVNALFPIRPPEQSTPGTQTKLLQQGGQNQKLPYGSIPVVLGRVRYTPPLAAEAITEGSGSDSYLRMLLCWGYGPLDISEVKINNIELDKLAAAEYITLEGQADPTAAELATLDRLYGQDATQQVFNQQLVCKQQFINYTQIINPNLIEVTCDNFFGGGDHNFSIGDKVQILVKAYNSVPTGLPDDLGTPENEAYTWELYYPYEADNTFTVSDVLPGNKFRAVPDITNFLTGRQDFPSTDIGYIDLPGALYGHVLQKPAYITHTVGSVGSEVDRIDVLVNFPQGLYGISANEDNMGEDIPLRATLEIGIKEQASSVWNEAYEVISAPLSIKIGTAYYNIDNDVALEPVYRWHYVVVTREAKLVLKRGTITQNMHADASGLLLQRLQAENFSNSITSYGRIPLVGVGEEIVWRFCVYGDKIVYLDDYRTEAAVSSGCDFQINDVTQTSEGTVNIPVPSTMRVTAGIIARTVPADSGAPYGGSLHFEPQITKNGFFKTLSLNVSKGIYDVRVRRVDSNEASNDTNVDACYLTAITGYSNNKPVNPPLYTDSEGVIRTLRLALSAIRVRATDQLNGNLDGVEGTVQSLGKYLVYSPTYPYNNGVGVTALQHYQQWSNATWSTDIRPIRNPAALFKLVLEHPANARASVIDIDDNVLKDWYHYCQRNGFTYDNVIAQPTSLLEVLKDIAAAGRASPVVVDGKWSVVIDREKPFITQIFTPHNSWGFEGQRTYAKLPHAFRINFINNEKGFQPDERIVYNDGYNGSNATLFETIELPGVTNSSLVFKHARFHLAQLKLRPETYTLNTDIENIICTRGDRVQVSHYVPMWGISSGRIKNRTSSTVFDLEEAMPIDNSSNYLVKIRGNTTVSQTTGEQTVITTDRNVLRTFTITNVSRTNNIITATCAGHPLQVGNYVTITGLSSVGGQNLDSGQAQVLSVDTNTFTYTKTGADVISTAVTGTVNLQDGYYTRIKLASSTTTIEADAGYLLMFGLQTEEFADLLVQSIEPQGNMAARLTLVDYAPAVFTSDTEVIPSFDSKITKPPELRALRIQVAPSIQSTEIVSNETVMQMLAPNTYKYRMRVPFNQVDLSQATNWEITGVEGQVALNGTDNWLNIVKVRLEDKSIMFEDVQEGKTYRIRARFISDSGRFGPWSTVVTHTVVGRLTPPNTPTGLTAAVDIDKLRLSWSPVSQIDVVGYEVRTTNSGWGTTTGIVYKGTDTTVVLQQPALGVATTYYVKAYDVLRKYSTAAASVVYTRSNPANVTSANITRIGTDFVINVTAPASLPSDFSHFEVQVKQNVTTGDIWDTAGVVKVQTGTGLAYVSIKEFPSPRIATGVGMPYRIAIRMVNYKGDKSSASFLANRYVKAL